MHTSSWYSAGDRQSPCGLCVEALKALMSGLNQRRNGSEKLTVCGPRSQYPGGHWRCPRPDRSSRADDARAAHPAVRRSRDPACGGETRGGSLQCDSSPRQGHRAAWVGRVSESSPAAPSGSTSLAGWVVNRRGHCYTEREGHDATSAASAGSDKGAHGQSLQP